MPRRVSFLFIVLLLFLSATGSQASTVRCATDNECEAVILKGSECIEGFCSNPYHKGGCLAQRLDGWNHIRVCNSQDNWEALEMGYCRAPNPGFDYLEIRIAGQNWESAFFSVWIIQILLSEILGVPVTLETGVEDYKLGFYDAESRMDYGTSYDWSAVELANEIGDCRLVDHSDGYKPCAHIIGEVWYGHDETLHQLVQEKVIERDHSTGTLGQQGLFIPRFTAMEKPSFFSYLGLNGAADNRTATRREVAEAFLRPTRWGEYCEKVSPNTCATEDGVATRAPETVAEALQFHSDEYQGHFRATAENDCDTNPDTCTGHFVDYPCGWSSFAKQQMHHLGINLVSNGDDPGSNGYSYSEMTEIWAAANATKSNVMMRWYWPEALYQTFLGSDAEFQRVTFPPPTYDCVEARVDSVTRCEGESEAERLGEAVGSCDEPPYALRRVISNRLYEDTYDPDIPYELQSPGYEAVKAIRVNGLQMGKIFEYWLKRGSDKWNFDPRDAACRWVVENFDLVRTWVPDSYPRVTMENEEYFKEPLFFSSVALLLLASVITMSAAFGVYHKRKTKAMVYAQVEFMVILLVGMLCVTLGSILLVAPASNWTCVSVVWLTNLGYTLELIPLIVKVQAINNLLTAARNMRRKVLNRNELFIQVFGIAFFVAIFITVWTVMDPPLKNSQYDITGEMTEYNETVVRVSYFCQSDSSVWQFLGAGWHTLMLIAASAMAYQTRKMRSDFNESMILAVLTYSHLFFVLLRLLLFLFEGNLSIWNVPRYLSIIYSADTIATCFIYFFPKIFNAFKSSPEEDSHHSTSAGNTRVSGLNFTAGSRMRASSFDDDFPVGSNITERFGDRKSYPIRRVTPVQPDPLTTPTPAEKDTARQETTVTWKEPLQPEQSRDGTISSSTPPLGIVEEKDEEDESRDKNEDWNANDREQEVGDDGDDECNGEEDFTHNETRHDGDHRQDTDLERNSVVNDPSSPVRVTVPEAAPFYSLE